VEYRSERKILVRDIKPFEVIDFVASYKGQDKHIINIKYIKKVIEFKSLSTLFLKGYVISVRNVLVYCTLSMVFFIAELVKTLLIAVVMQQVINSKKLI
jgi:hypothetical protein